MFSRLRRRVFGVPSSQHGALVDRKGLKQCDMDINYAGILQAINFV